MASKNGLTIKNEVTFLGHEGYATQGDIYLDDEKIAFWSQDGNGGEDTIYMEEKYSEYKFMENLKELNKDNPIVLEYHGEKMEVPLSIDFFMGDLLELSDLEKEYTKYRFKGYYMLISISNYGMRNYLPVKSEYLAIPDEQIKRIIKPQIEKFKQEHGSDGLKIEIFRDYKDFNIGKKLDLKDIYNFKKLEKIYKWDKLIFRDQVIDKDNFNNLDESKKQEISNKEFISSNKDYVYYEKDYFLEISKDDKNHDEKEMDR